MRTSNFTLVGKKGLKLKVRKFFGVSPTFVEVTGKKLGGGGGGGLASPILNKVKNTLNAFDDFKRQNSV